MRVKICGVTTPQIAAAAAAAGADAIGVVLTPARRQVTYDQARAIVRALPPFVAPVGVFVDAAAAEIEAAASALSLYAVQLHGDEPPELCASLQRGGIRVIKAIRIAGRPDLDRLVQYRSASALLLDTRVEGLAGGTGRTFPWEVAVDLWRDFRIIVAGGLTPENVRRALDMLQPYGLDVASGVETNGSKDVQKIRAFVAQVREWERDGRPLGKADSPTQTA